LHKSGEFEYGAYRLNIYADALQTIESGKITRVIFPEKISMINMGGIVIKYIEYSFEERVKQIYFICQVDDSILPIKRTWLD